MKAKAFRCSRKSQRGNTLVESSLVMAVFLFLIIGIADFGQFLFFHQSLVERVRAAVRYGTVNTYDADKIRNVVLFNSPDRPEGVTSPDLNLTDSMVEVVRYDSGTSEDRISVTISNSNYRFHFLSPVIAGIATAVPISATIPFEYQ